MDEEEQIIRSVNNRIFAIAYNLNRAVSMVPVRDEAQIKLSHVLELEALIRIRSILNAEQ